MKSIKKIGKAVAGSALLVGATLTGAAGLASADLGDYPEPFVDEDGEVASTIVVGESAKTIDVVGAVNIAGSLGNAAFAEEDVSVEGAASSWSATDGITLNRPNSNLYLDDNTGSGISGLVEGDLNILETQEFTDEGEDQDVEVEHEIAMGSNSQNFDASPRNKDEVGLYTEVPDVDSTGDYLFRFDAFLDETVAFNSTDMEDVEVELFGQTWTVSDDTDSSQLVLWGDSQSFDVETGESATETVEGDEHTFEVVHVGGPDSATVRVNGNLESVSETDTVDAGDSEVRVRSIYETGEDGNGIVQFGIGSEEMVLEDGQEVEVGGEDIDATEVEFNGGDNGDVNALEEISIYFGAVDRDSRFVEAGGTYEDPVFGIEFHYGGVAPNAAEDPAETVEVNGGAEEADVIFTDDSGDEAEVEFAYDADDDGDSVVELGDADGSIATYEGQQVQMDDRFVLNFDERAEMYEVTDVDYDVDGSEAESIVELENAVTGEVVELTEDDFEFADSANTGDGHLQEATFRLNREDYVVQIGLGDTDSGVRDNSTTASEDLDITVERDGGDDVLYPNLYTETDAAVFFAEPVALSGTSFGTGDTVRVPSTKSSGKEEITVPSTVGNTDSAGGVTYKLVNVDGSNNYTSTDWSAGEVNADDTHLSGGDYVVVDGAQDQSGATVIQPEDDDGNEASFTVTPSTSDDDEPVEVTSSGISGVGDASSTSNGLVGFEDDDDMSAAYSDYGTYFELDTSDDGELDVNFPAYESTVGMAVTGDDGSVSASGGSAGAATTQTPTGFPDVAALDSDSNIDSQKTNSNMILVGGPAVNALTQELADDGETQAASDYEEGSAMVQLVEDAFTSGQDALVVAGYSGEDTREAANYIANYQDNSGELAGQDQVDLTTQETQNAE